MLPFHDAAWRVIALLTLRQGGWLEAVESGTAAADHYVRQLAEVLGELICHLAPGGAALMNISVHLRFKSVRVFGVIRDFQLKRDRRDALSYVLRSVAADESVSIGVHPWLRENVSAESPDTTGGSPVLPG